MSHCSFLFLQRCLFHFWERLNRKMGNDPRGLGAFCAQTSLLISLLLLSAQLVSTKSGWNRLRSRSLPTKRHQQQWQEYGIDGSAKQQKLPRMHTLFSVECNHYFDWQTVGLMNSYRKSGHPGPITRLLSCTDDQLKTYPGMHLAPTHVVPSMSHHPKTGDWYPAINKPAGVVHWLENSPDAKNAEWVVILDADMIIRKPIIPWELGVEKGKPVAALYGYLIGCDNILAKLHTKHPELCDKVGGLLAMHMDDLRALAPLWLSKTEEVRADKEHWATNYTGDIYASGWISEMYGYSFGAAEVGLRHKISNDLMIYPGYIPWEGVEPILMHYGLKFSVGTWSFSKADHDDDDIVYQCNKLFPAPPYPKEVLVMEPDLNKRRGLFLSIECMNSLNEALVDIHRVHGCPESSDTKYTRFLKVWRETLRELSYSDVKRLHENESDAKIESMPYHRNKTTFPKYRNPSGPTKELIKISRIHTLFSTECSSYFDWQTVGLMHSFELSGQPGSITRLLSCTEDQLKTYNGMDLAPTHVVPSYSHHPLTNDWYPAINKPVSLLHWVNHVSTDAEFVVILDADMILRKPITPWDFGARKGHPVSVPYLYLIGCDNELAKLHTHHPEACEKVGGVIIMHIDDLREFAPLWLHKTEEVRADRAHWATNYSGDIYGHGWISEMYGYSFGAAELGLKHIIRNDIMHYPGNVPVKEVEPHVLHYGLEFSVGNWSFDKARWRDKDMTNMCWNFFPDPPDPESLEVANVDELRRDIISIGCIRTLNDALYLHHKRRGCHEAADEGAETVLENAEDEIMDIPERKEKHTMREDGEEQVARKPPDTLHDHETEEVVDAQELEEVDDEDGFEVEDNDIDKHWDMRKDPMTSHKESDDAQKTEDWENKETSSKGSTHTRKLSNSGGVITTEMMNPEYSMLAVWSVSFLLFVLIACYVSSSRLWHKNRQTKGKLKRVPNVTSNGEPYRTASNAD